MKILVIEDDKTVGEYVRRGLDEAGYHVDLVGDGDEGLRRASGKGSSYDMMVLDLRLPKLSGIDVLRTLRDRGVGLPVLVLTAQDSVDFKVQALRMGADDYVTKPFAFEELLARLEALLRRPGQLLGRSLQIANLAFDTESRQAFIDDKPQVLSARETAVLELLMRRKDRVVSKKLVEDHIFGLSGDVASNAVEVYIHRLRKQLSERGAKVQIHTIRGVGYIIAEEKTA